MIRALRSDTDAGVCDAIIASLPEWFGLDEGIRECAKAVRTQEGLVCERSDRGLVGFLTYERISPPTVEITWFAVHADHRGTGIGTELLAALVAALDGNDVRLLAVKTLSDRAGDPGPEYSATRAFYLARGFVPAAELDLFGPENPIQLLTRRF